MQPTRQQAQRSLEALHAAGPDRFGGNDEVGTTLDELPIEVFTRLDRAPPLRLDRLERARRRLAAGERPSAEDIAGRMIDRLVCDRLR
jgi:hypothetical protein